MFSFAKASIRGKLKLLLSMCVLFMLLIAISILMVSSFFSNRAFLSQQINALAEVTILAITPALVFDNNIDAQQTLETLKAHDSIIYAAVLKNDQQQAYAFFQQSNVNHMLENKKAIFDLCQDQKFTLTNLYICKPLTSFGLHYGNLVMVISLHDIFQRLITVLGFALLGLLIASFLIFFVLDKVSKKFTDPILELLNISEQVRQSGKYKIRANIYSSDEIGRLAQAFNYMLDSIEFWNDTLIQQKNTLEETVEERTHDLTETKNKALELADQAQKASIAKSEFLSVMSHEIRTPLNAIIGFSDLLKGNNLDQQQNDYIKIINKSGNSLLNQINDILDFSKIESGKMELDLLWFDLYELLITVLDNNRYTSSEKSLFIQHHIEKGLPRYLYGDGHKIEQILYNLLSNAVKFTEKGTISLEVKSMHTSPSTCIGIFSIKDTGIGISKQQLTKLFAPFTQADASITRKFGGTGLGLAIVKNMVELMDGDIEVQSVLGQGTEFILRIPLATSTPDLDSGPITPPIIGLITKQINPTLSIDLSQIGYSVEAFDVQKYHSILQQTNLEHRYAMFLFAPQCLDQALLWQQKKSKGGQRIPAAYCRDNQENSDIDQLLNGMPSIKLTTDGLKMVEQLKKILNTDLSIVDADNFNSEILILIVEDNPVNLLMAQNIVKKIGLNSMSATNGEQALKLYKEHHFSLILMDCQMPVMDGFVATSEIRQLETKNHTYTPIIALTANAFKEDREACFAAGMDDFLSKPFNVKQLHDLINQWISKQSKLDGNFNMEPEQMTEEVLDNMVIKELIEMDETGSKGFIRQISAAYFENAEQLIKQIETAFSNQIMDSIAKNSHQLKSSSMNVGAKKLSVLFKQLEEAANLDDQKQAEKLWSSIVPEYELVKKAYQKLLQEE